MCKKDVSISQLTSLNYCIVKKTGKICSVQELQVGTQQFSASHPNNLLTK